MSKAAINHVKDIGPPGNTGHVGSNGSTMNSRIEMHGTWDLTIGENVEFGNSSAIGILVNLLVDDGVPSRGHRTNIFNEQFKVCGVGYGYHKNFKHCCVIDYAGGFTEL